MTTVVKRCKKDPKRPFKCFFKEFLCHTHVQCTCCRTKNYLFHKTVFLLEITKKTVAVHFLLDC